MKFILGIAHTQIHWALLQKLIQYNCKYKNDLSTSKLFVNRSYTCNLKLNTDIPNLFIKNFSMNSITIKGYICGIQNKCKATT